MSLERSIAEQGECFIRNASELFVYERAQDLDKDKIQEARQFCGSCAVSEECLEFGLANAQDAYAVFGGELLSPERKVLDEAAIDRVLARL